MTCKCSAVKAFEIGRLLCQSYSNEEIAARLGIPLRTVKAGMARLFDEFDIEGGIKRVKLAVKLSQYPLFTEQPNL